MCARASWRESLRSVLFGQGALDRADARRGMNRLKTTYLLNFSQPSVDRPVYRAIHDRRAVAILEVGLGQGVRTERMLRLAAEGAADRKVVYVGFDPFEARDTCDGRGLSIRHAYARLRECGAALRLVPGDPLGSLARTANTLGPIDLVVISTPSLEWLSHGWYYFPRLLSPEALLFVREAAAGDASRPFTVITADEATRRASTVRRAA